MLRFSDLPLSVDDPEFHKHFAMMMSECMSTYPFPCYSLARNTRQRFIPMNPEVAYKLVDVAVFPDLRLKTCVDVGANIGAFSCLASENFKKVYAFEPIKQNYDYLKRVLDKSCISNVETHNLAAHSTSNEKIKIFHGADESSGGATVLSNGGEYEECETISLEGIYELVGEDTIDYMKVDIEGAEYSFLLGKDLSRVNLLSIELHGEKEKIEEMLRFLEEEFYLLWLEGSDQHMRKDINVVTGINKRMLTSHRKNLAGVFYSGFQQLQILHGPVRTAALKEKGFGKFNAS